MSKTPLASGERPSWTRRDFLKYSAAISGVALAGTYLFKGPSANNRLNIGVIGVGGKGAENMANVASENIVAICDIDAGPISVASQRFPGARRYKDFRKMLEQKDLDAVVINTADHTHAVAALPALQLGLHVYCEKPLTHNIFEARIITEAARSRKVATQMGNTGHSSEGMLQLVEWIQSGVIGPVREVHAWSDRPIWPQGISQAPGGSIVPRTIDWDLWLGPAPVRAYHADYHPFKWRGWWDFGTGALGDMGCHILDAPFWALELGHPTAVQSDSAPVNQESPPEWSVVRYDFPARANWPEVKLTWYDGGKQPEPELGGLSKGERYFRNGSLFIGDEGVILMQHGRGPRLVSGPAVRGFQPPDKTLPRSSGHYKEWIEACKGGEPAGSNFNYAGPLTEMVLLGNVAMRAGERIEWDGPNMKVTNLPKANEFVAREYRAGWELAGLV
jgi:predicted dehydrogenase